MEGCGTDFSGAVDAGSETQNLVCPNDTPTEIYDIGDNIEAGNGIIVEVADKFETAGLPVACINFYLGNQKLNERPVCVQNKEEPYQVGCLPNQYKDYGVKVVYLFSDINELRLNVFPATSGNVNTPLDLFSECIDSNKHFYDICTRYAAGEKLDGEEELTSGANHVFFPENHPELGKHYSEQLDACLKLAHEILLGGKEVPPTDYSLRSLLMDGKTIMVPVLGRALGSSYQINYFGGPADIDGFYNTILEYANLNDGKCYDGVIIHEYSHNIWNSVQNSYFPLNLQEGAARFIELAYPSHAEPKIYLDGVFYEGDIFVFEHESLGKGPMTYMVEAITPDEIELALLDEWGDVLVGTSFKTGVIDNLLFAGDFELIIDKPASDDAGPSVRLRIVRNQPLERPVNFKLECGEESYNLFYGLWMGSEFYLAKNTIAEGTGNNQPYISLSNPPYGGSAHYSTGACFFRGIEEAYNAAGADFSGFFSKLTASIHEYMALPLKEQFENEYCILDKMQKITNELGGEPFDINAHAEKFGYDAADPWCTSLTVNDGDTNDFGDLL